MFRRWMVAALFASLVTACGQSERPEGVGGTDYQPPTSYGPCSDGAERACGITLDRHDGIVDCVQGTQICSDGVWGECGANGAVTTKSLPDPGLPGLHTQSLGAPGSCASNPCDPYCKSFDDTPPGTLDGGADGLVYADGGDAITVGTTGGAVDGGAIIGETDPFGHRANVNGACTKDSDCNVDQHCVAGKCTSYKPGEFNAACVAPATTYGAVQPKLLCQFIDSGDKYGEFTGSAVVAQFDKSFATPPVMVAVATQTQYLVKSTNYTTEDRRNGKIKMVNGKSCSLSLSIPDASESIKDPDGGNLRFQSSSTPLLVDLNNDGVPEIVAFSASDGVDIGGGTYQARLLAFSVSVSSTGTYVAAPYANWIDPAGKVGRAWQTTLSGGNYAARFPVSANLDSSAPSAIDLDNDGSPEIVANGYVFNRQGRLIANRPDPSGVGALNLTELWGTIPILGDFDLDGKVEMIEKQGLFEASGFTYTAGMLTGMSWSADSHFAFPTDSTGSAVPWNEPDSYFGKGFQAVADFGAYGGATATGLPEVVWVEYNRARIMAMDGSPVFGFAAGTTAASGRAAIPAGLAGEIPVPGGGGGGVTIGDYDGDGLPEFGVAGAKYYTVFDIDCVSPRSYAGKTGKCDRANVACDCLSRGDCSAGGPDTKCAAGVLWSRIIQDQTSFVTGSSVFDFNGDGKAEVAYADECFTRIYDGSSGQVLFSSAHSSGTWLEQPIVSDVNLDGRADLIMGSARIFESTPGAGLYCPFTRVNVTYFGKDTTASCGGSACYGAGPATFRVSAAGTINIVTAGFSYLRFTSPSGTNKDVTLSGGTGSLTVAAGEIGDWTVKAEYSSSFSGSYRIDMKGTPLDGATAQATVSSTSTGEATDATFPGLPCSTSADCPTTTMACTAGLCRCTSDAQCGGNFKCIDPPASVGGASTCRATRGYGAGSGVSGLLVYSGPGAGWALSRYTWNEHAYTPVTVTDDAKVLKTAQCTADEAAAWTPANPSKNSFRQQLQYPGSSATGLPDLTIQYPCVTDYLPICNRGAGTAPPGVMVVGFPGNASKFDGDSDKMVTVGPCYTTAPLKPGECVNLYCKGAAKGTQEYMINPTCTSGAACTSNADCGGATCDPTSKRCPATCSKSGLSSTPPMAECSGGSSGWSFIHGNDGDGACGGSTTSSTATFTRDFVATCDSGTHVKWGNFTWNTTDPTGSNVVFAFRTASTSAGLATATAQTIATAGYAPLGSSTAADPQVCQTTSSPACFRSLGTLLTPNNLPYLRMEATLNPNASTAGAPVLNGWNVTFDCLPSE